MTDFLFIHGAGHGAWTWDYVKGAMEDAQRRTATLYHEMYTPGILLAPDLPGHGSRYNQEDPRAISLESCAEDISRSAEEAGLKRPVMVVHDLSGLIASEAARRMKEPPQRIIFLGAVVPHFCANVFEMLPYHFRLINPLLRLLPNTPPGSLRFHREVALKLMCNDMRYPEAASLVIGKLRPVPLRPFEAIPEPDYTEPLCPVTYIVLTRDWYMPSFMQRGIASMFPGVEMLDLEAGHEAPLSSPLQVVELLSRHI